MLTISKNIFENWNKRNVRYCHWKSNEHLMEGLDGLTDLDVYVYPDDKSIAEQILSELELIKFKSQPYCTYPNVDEWIGFDHDTGKLIHLHLHYQIITGSKFNKEYVFPIDDLIINTRLLNEETGVFTTSYELELLLLYSRITLKASDKKNIYPDNDYKVEIAYLKDRYSKDKLQSILNSILPANSTKVYEFIQKEKLNIKEWYDLFLIVKDWLLPYRSKNNLQVFFRYNYFRLRNRTSCFLNNRFGWLSFERKTMPTRGISVCFIGADGSGKSTISKEISKWLSWKIENRSFYLGSGDGYKHNRSIVSRIIAKLRHPAHNLVDISRYYVRQLKKADRYIQNGGIALYDRFPQTQFKGIYDGPKIAIYFSSYMNKASVSHYAKEEERNIELCQSYQPDIVFKLILTVEESIRRKHDKKDEIRIKVEITDKLKFEHSCVYEIDAMQDFSKELLSIKRIIWKKLLEVK